jgi:hypothetical protein
MGLAISLIALVGAVVTVGALAVRWTKRKIAGMFWG